MKLLYWNVDTQRDFMRPDGKLYVEGAETIEPKLKQLTQYAKDKGIKVVNTADWHNANSTELSDNPDFQTTFPKHCMMDTRGAEFVPATNPEQPYIVHWQAPGFNALNVTDNRNIVLYKDKFDIFAGNPHADEVAQLLKQRYARMVVYGVATNVCVNAAVNGLLDRGFKIHVPTDAIKELPNLPLDEVLKAWQDKGAVLTTVDEVVQYNGLG